MKPVLDLIGEWESIFFYHCEERSKPAPAKAGEAISFHISSHLKRRIISIYFLPLEGGGLRWG
jgi:hypothetical protein